MSRPVMGMAMTIKAGSEFESGVCVEHIVLLVVVSHSNFNVK